LDKNDALPKKGKNDAGVVCKIVARRKRKHF
jgi:hypothetical protein